MNGCLATTIPHSSFLIPHCILKAAMTCSHELVNRCFLLFENCKGLIPSH